MKWRKVVSTPIGHASLCKSSEAFLLVTNLRDGVNQYRFLSLEKINTFVHQITFNLHLQVEFTGGGDRGFARVFHRCTGELVQLLDHPP